MARVKRAVNAHKKRRVILERASGYRGQRSRLYRKAKEQVTHSLVYAYRDRRERKGDFRRLWIQRINAASRANGLTYNRLIQGLDLAGSRSTVASSPTSRSTSPRRSRRSSRPPRRRCPPTRRRPRRPRSPASSTSPGRRARSAPAAPGSAPSSSVRMRDAIDWRVLENPRSPRVRAVAKLAKRSARQETGLFLLEGPQAVAEALGVPAANWSSNCTRRRPRSSGTPISPRPRRDAGVDVEFVTEQVLDSMADTVTPQGIIAVVRAVPDVGARTSSHASRRGSSPSRGGARPGQRRHHHPGRGCRGRRRRHPHRPQRRPVQPEGRARDDRLDLPPAGRRRRRARPPCWSARARPGCRCSPPTSRATTSSRRGRGVLARPTAWLFGNEARGLDDEHLALADRAITVPIYGRAESMNLATAASRLPLRERIRPARRALSRRRRPVTDR